MLVACNKERIYMNSETSNISRTKSQNLNGSGHETAAVLLTGFAITW